MKHAKGKNKQNTVTSEWQRTSPNMALLSEYSIHRACKKQTKAPASISWPCWQVKTLGVYLQVDHWSTDLIMQAKCRQDAEDHQTSSGRKAQMKLCVKPGRNASKWRIRGGSSYCDLWCDPVDSIGQKEGVPRSGSEHTVIGCWGCALDSRASSHRPKGTSPRQPLAGLSPSHSWRSWLGASLPSPPPATHSTTPHHPNQTFN